MARETICYQSKSDYVFAFLKSAIMDGQLLPGERLVISKIAKKLAVSEIPVRDAIFKLTAEGFVDMKPNNRAVVSEVSFDDLKDILEMRIILEPECSKMATPFVSEDDIKELKRLVALMFSCSEAGDYMSMSTINRKFHSRIYHNCPNKVMITMVEDLLKASIRAQAVFHVEHGRGLISNKEHEQIVEAIENRDEEMVFELMTIQKKASLTLFLEKLLSYGIKNNLNKC